MEEKKTNSLIFIGIENRNEHFRKIGYSAIYFAATFIFLSYTSHAWSTSNAWDIGLRPLFSYDGMESLAGTGGWSVYRIAWVYLAPPIWGLVVSIFSLVAFTAIEGRNVHLRTILFWLAVNGFLLYLSYVIMGIISGQDYGSKLFTGFVAYYSWLLWSKGKIYGILIVQLIISLAYPMLFSKGILQLNYSRLLASKSNGKPIVFLNVFVLPATLGLILVAVATFPMDFRYQVIRMGILMPVALISLLGLALHKAKHIQIVKGGLKPVPLVGLIVLVVLLILSRFWLQLHVEPLW
ncbi:MAG: hypothetical protein KDB98_04090 [Flavobacteriales bacterium]|nr:hypothetical protein [Flavobacteriales bacterium]